jgi:hypothetical protein
VAQVRALVTTSMSDADLQDLIDREEAALARQIGPLSGPRTQVWYVGDPSGPWPVYGFGPLYGSSLAHMGARVASDRMGPLALLRPADAVEVTDNGVAVTPEDVRMLRNGTQIERASGGWTGPIVLGTYTPNDLSEVIGVVIGLCRLTVVETGYVSETIGGYAYTRETKSQSGVDPRKALIRTLQTHPPRGTLGVRSSSDTARVGPVVAP